MDVNNCVYCERCPARILSKKGDYHDNIGNITSQVLFVLPRYDEEAIKDLKEIYSLATGKPFEENCNLTYAVRCTFDKKYNIKESAIKCCSDIYYRHWARYYYSHTFVIGDSYKLYYDDKPNVDNINFVYNNKRCFIHFYNSLGIKYYSYTKFEAIKDKLIQDIRTLNL